RSQFDDPGRINRGPDPEPEELEQFDSGDGIDIRRAVVGDPIRSVAGIEGNVVVGPDAGVDSYVGACAAVDNVRARPAVEHVVAGAAEQDVVAAAAGDSVVAEIADQFVGRGGAG